MRLQQKNHKLFSLNINNKTYNYNLESQGTHFELLDILQLYSVKLLPLISHPILFTILNKSFSNLD